MEKEALSASQKVLICRQTALYRQHAESRPVTQIFATLSYCWELTSATPTARFPGVQLLVSQKAQKNGPCDGLSGALSSKMAKDTRSSPSPFLTDSQSEISQLCLVSLVSTHSQNERWLICLGITSQDFRVLSPQHLLVTASPHPESSSSFHTPRS